MLALPIVFIALALTSTAGCSLLFPTNDDNVPTPPVETTQDIPTDPTDEPTVQTDDSVLPSELRGTWCSQTNKAKCINLDHVLAKYPNASFELFPSGPDSPQFFNLCLEGTPCVSSDEVNFYYFPVGAGWNCLDEAAEFSLTTCNPDYTSSHDVTKPRLKILYNHQDTEYADTEPLYLNPSATGTFDDLTVIYG